MFIRPEGSCEKDYKSEWYKFIRKAKSSSFFVNPMPKFASDIVLTNSRIKTLIDSSLKFNEEEFEFGSKIVYSPSELTFSPTENLMADSFMTPMLYPYNTVTVSPSNPRVTVIGDMPLLVQREYQARSLSIKQVQKIYKECIHQWYKEENLFFSPEVKYPQVFITPKAKYMAEVLRQMSMTYGRIVAVVDADMLDYLEDAWGSLP